jgi:FkbM family methyltransferase
MANAHRAARWMSLRGFRGASLYWRLADRLADLPRTPYVRAEGGLLLPVDPDDWSAANSYRGLYERSEVALFRRLLSPGDVVVDVGANVGYLTSLFATIVGSRGRVIAVEPSPRLLPRLEQLVELLWPVPVELVPCALGASGGSAVLRDFERPEHSGAGTLRAGPGPPSGGAEVAVRTLSSLLEERGLSHVDLLKVDVEGYEPDVMAGAGSAFPSGAIGHAMIEVSPEFGPVDFAGELVASLAGRYDSFRFTEVGAWVKRPALVPVDAGATVSFPRQWNLLLSRRDRVAVLQPFIRR